MEKTEIINEDYMSLWFHPDLKIVHHKIKKPLPAGEFKRLLTTGADCLENNRCTKWLSDDSDVVAIAKEDNKWGDENWAPRVIKAGFKYWAVVMPKSALGSLMLKRFVNEYRDRGVTVEAFDSVDAAVKWLGTK